MIVCLCHGVNEKEVERCVAEGAQSVEDIGRACGAGTCCGCCQDLLSLSLEGISETESDRGPSLHEPELRAG